MFVSSKSIPDIHRAIDLGKPSPNLNGSEVTISLGALLSLGLLGHERLKVGDANAVGFLDALGATKLRPLYDLLESDAPQRSSNPFGTFAFEAYRIGGKSDLLSDDWTYFCDRFRRAASRGKQSPAVLALVSVFKEMADNVTWHAYEAPDCPVRALAGYLVTPNSISFSVVDTGQGFLRSLKRNPAWAGLKSDNEALDAVVSRQATSRTGEQSGGGFKQLFNGLLDLNGLVLLRSGSSGFTLRNQSSRWQRSEKESHTVIGSQVTVIIGRSKDTVEEPVP